MPCRACHDCLTGRYQACSRRKYGHGVTGVDIEPALWGGFAEYMYISPNSVLHKVDKTLPAELAVMYNPLGAGVRWACHLGEAGLGDTVLVLGAGQRGLAAVIAARAAGAGTIIVTGLEADAHKLALARELGADHCIVVDGDQAEDTVERVRRDHRRQDGRRRARAHADGGAAGHRRDARRPLAAGVSCSPA